MVIKSCLCLAARKAAFCGLLLFIAQAAVAQTSVGVDILNGLLVQTIEEDEQTDEEFPLRLAGSSQASLDFRSAPSPSMQGRVQLRIGLLGDAQTGAVIPLIDVHRAYLRARIPFSQTWALRLGTGKDRLSWGLGSYLNAGDLIFGADGRDTADLTQSQDVRDETAWMASLYFPLGKLAYLEAALLPQLPQLPQLPSLQASPALPLAEDGRAGGRLHASLGPLSLEGSYLYDGSTPAEEGLHLIGMAIQGTALGADLYGAGRLSLEPESDADIESDLLISAGIFRSFRIGYEQSLNARFEAMVPPEETEELVLYPELVWSPIRTVSVIARSVIVPDDESTAITAGATWNIFQGLTLLFFGTGTAASDEDDQVPVAFTLGMQARF